MEEFGVFAVFGVDAPPQRLLSGEGPRRVSVAVPPTVQQVVLFSSGPWRDRICVNADLLDAQRTPITIGKLTPYNRCLSWEQWEEETWTNAVTLNVTLEGGQMVKDSWSEPALILAVKEHTPKDAAAALAHRKLDSKKKRKRVSEDTDVKMAAAEEEENLCPNASLDQTTPVRKVRGHGKGGQKLFSAREDATKSKRANSTGDVQGIVGRTPPQSGARSKSGLVKTPTHTASPGNPSGRWGQTLCPIDSQTAILIGGQGARMQFCKDPMWKLCTEDMSWVAAETLAQGPTPESRIGHSSVYDPDSKRIFVFGGSKNKKWFNDVHILDTQSWKWTMVEAQGKVPPLAYHSCSMFRGELFVLGGVFPRPNPVPDGCSDSLYIFDPQLSIWYQPVVIGDTPSPRSGHSACVMPEGKIYIFGGWDTPVCYNDMFVLDLGLMEFSAVQTSGKAPPPRCWHGSAVLSNTKFLIYGGYNANNALADTFVFDTDTNVWTEVTLPQLSVARAGHSIAAMEMDPASGGKTLLVFGGGDNEGTFYADVTTVTVVELLALL
ncbi:kelch repeat-containing protein [Nerophis lumbriciformis]|uniref:kelch repeat-containing protein n=1 Tax=Nerophis lumbriciformis TaxID=546530 RepID=UPI002AE027D0|nr:kelch repeat-containing protein [Nerophis lumbriciformis]XP_061817051.1 kelch repeat-containing protein [Nerophis lumbriciformis]